MHYFSTRIWISLRLSVCAVGLSFTSLVAQLPVPDVNGPAKASMDKSMLVTATTSSTVPHITLHFRDDGTVNTLSITRREKGDTGAGTALTPVSIQDNFFADNTAQPGIAYEYRIIRSANKSQEGSIVAGYNIPLVESRGNVLLLVDETMVDGSLAAMTGPLAAELTRLKRDLEGDGWKVYFAPVPRQQVEPETTLADDANSGVERLAELTTTLSAIQNAYNDDPTARWALFIVGRVPQPYSGYSNRDGHSNHTGAWPTDRYYANLGQGNWTDSSTTTIGSGGGTTDKRNWNTAGDGKFDQFMFYAFHPTYDPILETGRVDMHNVQLPRGPSEADFLRQYLNRDHAFRHGKAPYYLETATGWHNAPSAGQVVERRARLYELFTHEFSVSAWSAAAGFFGSNTGEIDFLAPHPNISVKDPNPHWFEDMQDYPTYFGYNAGAGGPQSSVGSGTTVLGWALRPSKAVFTHFFGSYFGDFDYKSTQGTPFLKGAISGPAESLGLVNMWSGWPYYLLYHMALGDTVGYSAKFSEQASHSVRFWKKSRFEGSSLDNVGVWMNLLGNPTLRLHTVLPPEKPRVESTASGVKVSWDASADPGVAGYHVYRSDNGGPFVRLTGSAVTPNTTDPNNAMGQPIAVTSYTDASAVDGSTYTYAVKSVKIEESASGTYVNQSVGLPLPITHNLAGYMPSIPQDFQVQGVGTGTYQLTWENLAVVASSFEVERMLDSTGVWTSVASVAGDVFSYQDVVAATEGVPRYRVRAINPIGSSDYAYAADYNLPGIITTGNVLDFTTNRTFKYIPRGSGTAQFEVNRFNGTMGEVSVTPDNFAIWDPEGDVVLPTDDLTWAHGDGATKTVDLSIPDNGPHLTKLYRIRYKSPTNGLVSDVPEFYYPYGGQHMFAIYDPSVQTLPSPWLTKYVGQSGQQVYPGYAEYLDGKFGVLARTHLAFSGKNDSMQIVYRPVTGDFTFSAQVLFTSNVITSSIDCGIFVRSHDGDSSASNSGAAIAAAQLIGNFSPGEYDYTGKGLRATFRTTDGGNSAKKSAWGSTRAPYWLRVKRVGNDVEIYHSPDGQSWSQSGLPQASATITDLGATAFIGMLAAANNVNGLNVDYPAYVQYGNLSLQQPPTVPANLTVVEDFSDTTSVSWSTLEGVENYVLQRSTTSGSGFVTIASPDAATGSYTDEGLTEGTTYYYRIASENTEYGASAYSAEVSVSLSTGSASPWYAWKGNYFSPAELADPEVSGALKDPDGDGVVNLIEYALQLDPQVKADESDLPKASIENSDELVLTYRKNNDAGDLTYTIQSSSSMQNGSWADEVLVEEVINGDVDGDGKTSLVKVRKTIPSGSPLFIRLKVDQP